jgi:soluble lytic murein transglycosylase-like protein
MASVAIGLPLLPLSAQAGRQVEEPLADSVRSALSSAIHQSAPPAPLFANDGARQLYAYWLAAMTERLRKRRADALDHKEFLPTVWYESKRAGLDVALVLGLIQVESNFRKFAISSVGARGYMQVMPFWTRLIGDGDAGTLFHLQTNLRFGCVILRHYLDAERGDVFMALGRYNGSRGQRPYPDAVLAARRAWEI